MGKFLAGVVNWLKGKKTILGGGLIMAAGVAGVALGKVDPTVGLGVLGFGLSIAGAGAKANRHQAQLLTALNAVAQVAADKRAGNTQAAIHDAEDAAINIGLSLVPPVQPSPEGGAAK
jgi:hypothetical protein